MENKKKEEVKPRAKEKTDAEYHATLGVIVIDLHATKDVERSSDVNRGGGKKFIPPPWSTEFREKHNRVNNESAYVFVYCMENEILE